MNHAIKKVTVVATLLLVAACTSIVATPKDLTNRAFPQVRGQSLTKDEIIIPNHYNGKATTLLVGYKQNAQFDIDRWILGILQAEVPVELVEVPTISGMVPQMIQGFINSGMRGGIPKEDWGSVVTVYSDAQTIIDAIGNESPQNAHVVLLNRSGEIVWSTNRGYSAAQVLELKKVVEALG